MYRSEFGARGGFCLDEVEIVIETSQIVEVDCFVVSPGVFELCYLDALLPVGQRAYEVCWSILCDLTQVLCGAERRLVVDVSP